MDTKENRYIFPRLLSRRDLIFFRVGGSGLANCLFVYARAIIEAEKTGMPIVSPTWFNLVIRPYLLRQSDKRHYRGVFENETIGGLKKAFILLFKKNQVKTIAGRQNYFQDIKGHSETVRTYLLNKLSPTERERIDPIPTTIIAVHIRLGDYKAERRVPLEWYIALLRLVRERIGGSFEISVFSDGTDEELVELLALPHVKRRFYGSAIADIWALSRARLIIASDSTFSAWGAYLGQVPIVFHKRHFSSVLDDPDNEIVVGDDVQRGVEFITRICLPFVE